MDATQHRRAVALFEAACIEKLFHGTNAAASDAPFRHASGIEGLGREGYDLYVGGSSGVADKLGAELGELPGATHELSLFAHDGSGVAQPERRRRMLKARRGKTSNRHGQVASYHKEPAVRVEKLKRGIVNAGGALKRTPVFEKRRFHGQIPVNGKHVAHCARYAFAFQRLLGHDIPESPRGNRFHFGRTS